MSTPETRTPRWPLDRATRTWLLLVALTLASAMASTGGHHPLLRLPAALAVAALCALKARSLVRGYLVPRDAGPVIERIVLLFAMVAPVLLALSAVAEAWRSVAG